MRRAARGKHLHGHVTLFVESVSVSQIEENKKYDKMKEVRALTGAKCRRTGGQGVDQMDFR